MENSYTCVCGNQTWFVLEQAVRCAVCGKQFAVQMTPLDEFNAAVSELVEEAEEG
jgi:hypothetical protein